MIVSEKHPSSVWNAEVRNPVLFDAGHRRGSGERGLDCHAEFAPKIKNRYFSRISTAGVLRIIVPWFERKHDSDYG